MTAILMIVLALGLFLGGMALGHTIGVESKKSLRSERNSARLEANRMRSALLKIAADDAGNPALEAKLALESPISKE